MTRRPAWVLACLLAGLASPARADWQYTRWGMTPEAVIAASDHGAKPADLSTNELAPGARVRAEASYSFRDFGFRALFVFAGASPKLSAVRLELTSGRCDALLHALTGLYGEPDADFRSAGVFTASWSDEERANWVDFRRSPSQSGTGACVLRYSPLSGSDQAH